MVRQYKLIRVPIEAVRGFQEKKERMEKNIKSWTGKVVKIPMTRVMVVVANNPSEIHEQKIIKLFKRKVKR